MVIQSEAMDMQCESLHETGTHNSKRRMSWECSTKTYAKTQAKVFLQLSILTPLHPHELEGPARLLSRLEKLLEASIAPS